MAATNLTDSTLWSLRQEASGECPSCAGHGFFDGPGPDRTTCEDCRGTGEVDDVGESEPDEREPREVEWSGGEVWL